MFFKKLQAYNRVGSWKNVHAINTGAEPFNMNIILKWLKKLHKHLKASGIQECF